MSSIAGQMALQAVASKMGGGGGAPATSASSLPNISNQSSAESKSSATTNFGQFSFGNITKTPSASMLVYFSLGAVALIAVVLIMRKK